MIDEAVSEDLETANLAFKPDEKLIFKPDKTAELIYKIALAAKEQSNDKNINQIPLPRTLKEATEHPVYGPKWKEAIENELASLTSFNTWNASRLMQVGVLS
jgi:hypothetical protein